MNYLTVKQVAERLAVAQSTIYLLCSESKIDHIRVGVGRGRSASTRKLSTPSSRGQPSKSVKPPKPRGAPPAPSWPDARRSQGARRIRSDPLPGQSART
jgi:excisionase family DNA binding protein